jgi:hypothetical protein
VTGRATAATTTVSDDTVHGVIDRRLHNGSTLFHIKGVDFAGVRNQGNRWHVVASRKNLADLHKLAIRALSFFAWGLVEPLTCLASQLALVQAD